MVVLFAGIKGQGVEVICYAVVIVVIVTSIAAIVCVVGIDLARIAQCWAIV